MSHLESLYKRVEQLEENLRQQSQIQSEIEVVHQQAQLREAARVSALHSIARDLCLHEGISQECFVKHLEERTSYFLDFYLQKVQSTDESLAAHVDNRTLDEVPEGEGFQPLFPNDD